MKTFFETVSVTRSFPPRSSTGSFFFEIRSAILIGFLFICGSAGAQTSEQLKSLFFDPVYPGDPVFRPIVSRDQGEGGEQSEEAAGGRFDGTVLENIRQYETSIDSLMENGGAFDPQLAQEYLAAGSLYRQTGDYENAVSAFENAMHIQRVNQGLFTMSQIEAVRSLIDTNKEAQNYGEADKYHEYLYYLQSQNPGEGSGDQSAATMEWADWNMEAYRRLTFLDEEELSVSGNVTSLPSSMLRRGQLVAIESDLYNEVYFVPRSDFMGSPTGSRMQYFTAKDLIDPRLKTAEELYDKLIGGPGKDTSQLADNWSAVYKRANVAFLFKTQIQKHISNTLIGSNISNGPNRAFRSISVLRDGYADNRENLQRVAEEFESTDPVRAARAYIDLGDWDLSFERPQRANESYNKARELLLAAEYSEDEVTDFITPEAALFIPAFATYEHTRAFHALPPSEEVGYMGYIDVSFDKRRNGDLRNIRITNVSENTGQSVRSRLLDLLETVKVRPRIIEGRAEEVTDIRVRYYYTY